MDEERDPAAQSERPAARADTQPQTRDLPRERYGIVAVQRRRKDDGRALILYTRLAQGGR